MTSIACRPLPWCGPLLALLLVAAGCDKNERCAAGALPSTWARFDGVIPPSMTVCRRDAAGDPAEVEAWYGGSASAAAAAAATHLAGAGWQPEPSSRGEQRFYARGADRLTVEAQQIKGTTRVFFRATTIGCQTPAGDGTQCVDGTTILACTSGVGTRVVQACERGCLMGAGGPTTTCR